jgi:hypothetical protein
MPSEKSEITDPTGGVCPAPVPTLVPSLAVTSISTYLEPREVGSPEVTRAVKLPSLAPVLGSTRSNPCRPWIMFG